MVFGHDVILNTPFIADWGAIRVRKNKIIDKNNQILKKIVNCTLIEYGIKY